MKKLLSIIGIFSLTITTGTNNIVACNKKLQPNKLEYDDKSNLDLNTALEIKNKTKKYFNNEINNLEIIDCNEDIDLILKKVNNNKKYTLNSDNPDEKKIKQYFINLFKKIVDKVNNILQNEYSNYFIDSLPILIQDSDADVDLWKIFIDKLISESNVEMNSFSAIRVDLRLPYKINFKKYSLTDNVFLGYNVTNETKKLKILLKKNIKKITTKLSEYYKKYLNVIIDNNNDFNSLYKDFIIDYSQDISDVDLIFKNLTKKFLSKNPELKNLTLIDDINLINLRDSNLSFKNKGYNGYLIGTNNENLSNLDKVNYINFISSHNWAGEGLAKNWNNDIVNKIVNFIKTKEAPIFNSSNLILSTFNINIRSFIFNGLQLTGDFIKDSNQKDLVLTFSITDNGINEKLTNFGNLIKEFYQFYNANLNKNETKIEVNNNEFTELIKLNNLYGNSKVFNYLTSKFKQSENTKKLKDYNLFFFDNVTGYKHYKGNYYSEINILKFDKLNKSDFYMPWIALFIFGKHFRTGKYYSVNSYYGISISIQKKD